MKMLTITLRQYYFNINGKLFLVLKMYEDRY